MERNTSFDDLHILFDNIDRALGAASEAAPG
jgi:hypothetical protein